MTKITKSILCLLMSFIIIGIPASAEEGPMNMSWKADYKTMELTISFTSPASYRQRVTAVMYDADIEAPLYSDFKRISEVEVTKGEKKDIVFKISNGLSEADGHYKVKLQGSGALASTYTETKDVYVLNPSKVSNLLGRLNSASTNALASSCLLEMKDAMQFTLTDDAALLGKQMSSFISIRDIDYCGEFKDLVEALEAFAKADVLVYLKDSTATSEGMRAKVEGSAAELGVNILDTDYIAVKDRIYNLIIKNKNTYNGTGINSAGQVTQAIEDYKAISMVNAAVDATIENVITAYRAAIGISDSYFNKFLSYSKTNQQKVLRQILEKDFNTKVAIKSAFEKGVDNAVASIPDSEGGTSGGGTSGGYGSGGSSSTAKPDAPGTPVAPQTSFNDCGKNHWANTFVSALAKTGIITGYADGSYRPEKHVSREEFVKMIVSATGLYKEDAKCEFSDVPENAWFYAYAASAKLAGIVNGVNDTSFGAGTNITREDVSVITARIIEKFNKTTLAASENAETSFADNDSVSSYAKAGINALVDLKIINGFEDGKFKPKALLTRAEAAKIIYLLRETV